MLGRVLLGKTVSPAVIRSLEYIRMNIENIFICVFIKDAENTAAFELPICMHFIISLTKWESLSKISHS